jgi:hypothetical protein
MMTEYAYIDFFTTATGLLLFFTQLGFDPETHWPIEGEAMNAASRSNIH